MHSDTPRGSSTSPESSAHERAGETLRGGWADGGNFFGAVMAGFLLGFGSDWLLGTKPLFIVIGIVLGSVAGFYSMMSWAKAQEERDRLERYRR